MKSEMIVALESKSAVLRVARAREFSVILGTTCLNGKITCRTSVEDCQCVIEGWLVDVNASLCTMACRRLDDRMINGGPRKVDGSKGNSSESGRNWQKILVNDALMAALAKVKGTATGAATYPANA